MNMKVRKFVVKIGSHDPADCHSHRTFESYQSACAFMWAARQFAHPEICCMWLGLDGYIDNRHMEPEKAPPHLADAIRFFVDEDNTMWSDNDEAEYLMELERGYAHDRI